MWHPDYKYIAVATHGIDTKRKVILMDELELPRTRVDCYSSWCRYKSEFLSYWATNSHSLRGYQGSCFTDYIPIDIDNDDLNYSLKTCRDFIKYIECSYDVPIKSLNIYFSGSKGFHIEIPISLFGKVEPASDLPYRIKDVVRSFGFDDIDQRIYKANSLLRIPNSINSKTTRYKIPITHKEITNLTLNQILDLSGQPRQIPIGIPPEEWQQREQLTRLWKECVTGLYELRNSDLNYLNFPSVEKGLRNDTAFNISRQLLSKGFNIELVKKYIIGCWNPTNHPPIIDTRSILRTVESAQEYDVHDSGLIQITKHFRTDPYYNSFNNDQKSIYTYIISHLNEKPKLVWMKYPCRPNQIIFSISSLAEKTCTTEQIVRTVLKKLIGWGRIDVETLKHNGKNECSRLTFFPLSLIPSVNRQTNKPNFVGKQ